MNILDQARVGLSHVWDTNTLSWVPAELGTGTGSDVNVTNTSLAVTGPLTDTQLRATALPVSVSGTVTVGDGGSSLTVDAPVTTPVFVRLSDGSAAIATLPVSVASAVTVAQGTATNLKAQAEAYQGGTAVGSGNPLLVSLANTASNSTAVNVAAPTLTKSTQGANGFSVQPLRDAGRTSVHYYAVAAAAGTTGTETAITLTKASGTSATTTGTSFVVTSGKRFRIKALSFATRGHNTATAQATTFNFRINTGGAVTTTSTPVVLSVRSATPATANAWDRVIVPLPDGFEIAGDGTLQFGITAAATYVTNAPTWDVTLLGFEY